MGQNLTGVLALFLDFLVRACRIFGQFWGIFGEKACHFLTIFGIFGFSSGVEILGGGIFSGVEKSDNFVRFSDFPIFPKNGQKCKKCRFFRFFRFLAKIAKNVDFSDFIDF